MTKVKKIDKKSQKQKDNRKVKAKDQWNDWFDMDEILMSEDQVNSLRTSGYSRKQNT